MFSLKEDPKAMSLSKAEFQSTLNNEDSFETAFTETMVKLPKTILVSLRPVLKI